MKEEAEEAITTDKLMMRAEKNPIYRVALKVVQSKMFQNFITGCILVNTGVLAMDKYPVDTNLQNRLEWLNVGFFSIFFIEMVIKFVGMGFRQYLKDKFNTFDCLIVLLSCVEMAVWVKTMNGG